MLVSVKFFASIRETLQRDELRCELPAVAGLQDLLHSLRAQLGADFAVLEAENIRIAINQQLLVDGADALESLKAGDEVAFLPPVTGG